ncbi:transcriptional regulator domain protein [Mycobacterium ulcerans str. Harvey]|uniref:Transcriptional regulator domain protein n=1 Tax=Mycobacterium ulcerans str. Harvey TaxID=1299332 RepID=A0ABN0R6T4_MYCUL|nr:transcriptional regulator domain protein [Mycobacterium ulcerans str. Harvey]
MYGRPQRRLLRYWKRATRMRCLLTLATIYRRLVVFVVY